MEVPGGFEPPNNGFADRPLGPLGHGTPSDFLVYPQDLTPRARSWGRISYSSRSGRLRVSLPSRVSRLQQERHTLVRAQCADTRLEIRGS